MTRDEALKVMGLIAICKVSDLKKIYRKLAKETHPDINGGDDKQFKRVSIAYDILTGKREADVESFSNTSTQSAFRRRQPNTTYTHKSIFEFEPA